MVQRKVWHALVALVLILTFFAQGTAVIAGTTGTLTGVLQDASTQAPLANVKVTVASPSQTATATTDASGRLRFSHSLRTRTSCRRSSPDTTPSPCKA